MNVGEYDKALADAGKGLDLGADKEQYYAIVDEIQSRREDLLL